MTENTPILTAISGRRAWRALSSEQLSAEEIAAIIDAGLLAPSCFNNQPWRILVATDCVADEDNASAGGEDASEVPGTVAAGDAQGSGASGATLGALKDALSAANAWARKAPALVVVAARASDDCRLDEGRDYYLFDAGLCVMAMLTQATAMGIIAHPMAGFDPKAVRKVLGIPRDYVPIVLIALARHGDGEGLSMSQLDSERRPRERKPRAMRVAAEQWPEDWSKA